MSDHRTSEHMNDRGSVSGRESGSVRDRPSHDASGGPSLPTLRVRGTPREALRAAVLAALPPDVLVWFLTERRWFGAKGLGLRTARLTTVVPLPWDAVAAAVAVVEVELGDGSIRRYQLPLAVRNEGAGEGGEPGAVLATVEGGGGRALLFDATEDAAFRSHLLSCFTQGLQVEADGVRWIAEPVGEPLAPGAAPGSRVGSAEQSNTSIIYGDVAILKLFRRLEVGENPDVEISHFLTTKTTFRGTPELLGLIYLEGHDGTRSVAGMLSRFVASTGDAWAHALDRVRAYLGAPDTRKVANPFAEEARGLGRVTRALHEALASDATDAAFAPVPATPADVDRWAGETRRMMAQAFDLLAARLDTLDPPIRAAAAALIRRREAALARVADVVDEVTASGDAGLKVRHHGDYHLGQVLRTRDGGWMIIDFEGEPARPLAERRSLHSPLRDVAGMLRSFAYAAAAGAMEVGGVGVDPTLEQRAARWEREARAAFLDGYFAPAAGQNPALLPDERGGEPSEREASTALLTIFEIEKIFYELSYELNNRPAWVWIPLRGIAKLY